LKLVSVILARAIGYLDVFGLNGDGKLYTPALVQGLTEQFRFQKFPQTLEEYDIRSNDGMVFLQGISGNRPIQKFMIGANLIFVETRSNTDDSKELLEEILSWGATNFGLSYDSATIKRFAYVNCVSFYSDVPILANTSAPLTKLSARTSDALSGILQEPIQYEPVNIEVGYDALTRKYGIARFQITRRADIKFSDNTYYSEAPLPTDIHLDLLKQYEMDILAAGKATRV
jgi:hypothetical protein